MDHYSTMKLTAPGHGPDEPEVQMPCNDCMKKLSNDIGKGKVKLDSSAVPFLKKTAEFLKLGRQDDKPPKYEKLAGAQRDGIEHIVNDLVGKNHDHLAEAKFELLKAHCWDEDEDGIVALAKVKKVTGPFRAMTEADFVMMFNWQLIPQLSEEERVAIIDHELAHCQVSLDENGEMKRDAKGRPYYRIRKHEFEEFAEIVRRHRENAKPGVEGWLRRAGLQLELFAGELPSMP